MKYLFTVLFSLIIFSSLTSGDKISGKEFLLSKHRAGYLKIGMSVDALYTKYKRELTKLVDLYLEGTFSPALEIYLDENQKEPSLIAEIGWQNNWTIYRIRVYDKRFKTAENIGVGSTLGDIRKAYKIDWMDFTEEGFLVRVEEIGMSFALDINDVPPDWEKSRNQNMIPDGARVIYVIIN